MNILMRMWLVIMLVKEKGRQHTYRLALHFIFYKTNIYGYNNNKGLVIIAFPKLGESNNHLIVVMVIVIIRNNTGNGKLN